jgi:hypothetical protein
MLRMARDESKIFTIGGLTLNHAYVIFGGFHVVEDQPEMEKNTSAHAFFSHWIPDERGIQSTS